MSTKNSATRLRWLFFFTRWRGIAAWLGPLFLIEILILIYIQAVQWSREVEALSRRERLHAIDSCFLDSELLSLQRAEERDELPENLLDIYWGQYLNLVSGTGREETARTARGQSRARRGQLRQTRAAERREEIERLLRAGLPVAAVDAAFKLPPEVALTEAGRAIQVRVRKELLRRTGLVFVDWKDGSRTGSANAPRIRRTPYLIEARPVSREEFADARRMISSVEAVDDVSPPATGVAFEEAQAFAAARGRRLPSFAEREAAEREIRLVQPPGPAPSPTLDAAPHSEWIEAQSSDEIARRGYGWCFAAVADPERNGIGVAPHVAPQVALTERRRMDRGHADVSFRCAIDLARAIELEREGPRR